MHLPNPVIRSHYRNGFIKQYVRDDLILRTDPATNNVTDYGVNKAVENLPALRAKLASINDNYLDIQQDTLETFVDRGELQHPGQPTCTPSGKRIPGLKLDNPRQLALCMPWSASPRSRRLAPSVPVKSIRVSPPLWAAPQNATV